MTIAHHFLQAAILVMSGAAIWLINDWRHERRLIGCVVGLLAQPFWLYTSLTGGQWGIALLSVWYALAFARGLDNNGRPWP